MNSLATRRLLRLNSVSLPVEEGAVKRVEAATDQSMLHVTLEEVKQREEGTATFLSPGVC